VTERPDVLVVEGGMVEVPGRVDLGWNFGLPVGTAFACVCEPLLLGLEGRPATTAGVDTPVAVMHDLARWALLHGFRLAGFQGFGRLVLEEDWAMIREVRYPTRRSTRAAPAGPGG